MCLAEVMCSSTSARMGVGGVDVLQSTYGPTSVWIARSGWTRDFGWRELSFGLGLVSEVDEGSG